MPAYALFLIYTPKSLACIFSVSTRTYKMFSGTDFTNLIRDLVKSTLLASEVVQWYVIYFFNVWVYNQYNKTCFKSFHVQKIFVQECFIACISIGNWFLFSVFLLSTAFFRNAITALNKGCLYCIPDALVNLLTFYY